jgi:hypothetical protein
MVQTAVADPTMRKGQIIQGPWPEVISRVCEGAITAGNLVQHGTDPERQVQPMAALPAADVDAIATAAVIGSATTAQNISATTFDGAVGRDRITPARTVSVNFDASADWDTPSGECRVDLYGFDAAGTRIKDCVSRPNCGAVVYAASTRLAFSDVTELDIEACNGAGGTATIGLSNDTVELSPNDFPGIAVYELMMEPTIPAAEFADEDEIAVLTHGRICSIPEHAVSVGDDVYVRILEDGADLRGQLTGMDGADTPATYAKLAGARWVSAAEADAPAKVEL